MSKANIPSGGGGKQGVRSPAGAPLNVRNGGPGTRTYKGVASRAQVTGLNRRGSKSVSGGKTGPSGRA